MKIDCRFLPLVLTIGAALGALSHASADQISWADKRGSLSKAGFSSSTATHVVYSDSGANRVAISLSHHGTSRDLFTFSKWEIDRWGDPTAQHTENPGSWQVVSNAANDVVLGIWGFWGWDGAPTSPRVFPNESTTYEISLEFDQPVTALDLPLHGINALFTNSEYNCVDELSVDAFFNDQRVDAVRFETPGTGVSLQTPGVVGNPNSPHGSSTSTYDEGSVRIVAAQKLNRIVLRLSNRAVDPANSTFQSGQQTWSLALGDLSFENEPVDPSLNATAIEWLSRKGQLSKPGYSNDKATTTALSKDGRVRVSLTLEHDQSTPNLTTYSKWEIDQWGDPTGEFFSPGSWQIVTNAANSVVLGLWGYWGGPGETMTIGDFTCYRVILDFDHPVYDLNLPLHGINGFLKPSSGFNSGDEVEVIATRNGHPIGTTSFTNLGRAMKQVGSRLVGDYSYQIDDGISGQHMSDEGSCQARFTGAVDQVVLTFINRAGHPDPAAFQSGMQTWSMALGDLTFTHQAPDLTNLSRQPGVTISQSSNLHAHTSADHLNDGNTNGNLWDQSVSHTEFEDKAWVQIDLGAIRNVSKLLLWERTDALAAPLENLVVFVSNQPFTDQTVEGTEAVPGMTTIRELESLATGTQVQLDQSARYIRLQREGTGALSLAEIEVLGPASSGIEDIAPATVASDRLAINSASSNPLLNQLGYFAFNTDTYPAGLEVIETSAGVDLAFERPAGLDTLLDYALELSPDLVTWTTIPTELNSLNTIRLEGVDTIQPELRRHGFARLRVTVAATSETTTTKPVGWYRTTCHEGFQTHGLSLNRPAFGAGRILTHNGALQATVSGTMNLTNLGPAYMEIMDGAYEGHRIELQAITNGEGTALLEGTATGSTLAALADDVVGAAVIVRPHWTLETAYPAADSTPHRDPISAAQALFFENGRYRTFYSHAHPESAYWTELGDGSLANADLEIIAPGHGIFLCQPNGEPHEVTIVGHVRDNLFRQPLVKGHHLVAQAFPISQTPHQRLLDQSHGFQSASDPGISDSIQLWQGDHSPTEEAFESYFYFSAPGSQDQPFWVRNDDNTLFSHNETALFHADRAAFIEVKADIQNYQNNLSLPNQ